MTGVILRLSLHPAYGLTVSTDDTSTQYAFAADTLRTKKRHARVPKMNLSLHGGTWAETTYDYADIILRTMTIVTFTV